MKLLCLGTGAADWDPKLATADPAFRRLTAALIGDDLMIDCGPCVYEFAETFGYPDLYRNVKAILVTHSHGDHFHAGNVARLAEEAAAPVTVYGDPVIGGLLPLSEKLRFVPLAIGETTALAGDYEVTALPANHSTQYPEEQPLHYVLRQTAEDKTVFWGCDGAWLYNRTYHCIKQLKFDAMFLDCTVGDLENDFRSFEHNNIRMIDELLKSLVGWHHVIKPDGQVYANHMARTLHTGHEMLCARLAPLGVIPCRDNMEIEI
ncbi:MAG: MBL fold metallo-hydrolase [Clostridia bacterium]|nr:MBL fold metallo-hydrolase [Clostridia bacterium]